MSRNAPGLHVRKRANSGCPFIKQQAEVAEGSRRGDRGDQSVAFIHPNAHLHRAVGEQIKRICDLALADDDRAGREMGVLARTDQSSDIHAVQAPQVIDAAKELLLGLSLFRVLIG